MRRVLGVILSFSVAAAACGGKSSPISPEAGMPAASGSATIAGAVQGALPSAVAVAGTALSSSVDAGGRFTLTNVPSGDVQLQFSGGGASAMLPVAAVQPAQRIDLVVSVSGSSAAIESQVRSGGGGAELEGRVESLPPTPPSVDPLSFSAAGRLVKTDSATQFRDGSQTRTFADLRIGMRVHVKGTPSGDAIMATLVELQNSQVDIPVEVNGVIDSLMGTSADFQFKIGSRLVKGDTNTMFFGDGDTPDTFADLKDGVRVEVKGQQRDGFVYAVRIHINDDDDDDEPPDTSASIHGTLKAIGGAVPTLDLTVDTTMVHTSSSTTVKRRGDFQTLNELKIGQSLHVIGARRADGSLDARHIEINDDAVDNEVEIEGSVGGLKGTCPSLSFGINGYAITTNGLTTFDGLACAAIKSGDKVKVNGTKQGDGSVLAKTVKKS